MATLVWIVAAVNLLLAVSAAPALAALLWVVRSDIVRPRRPLQPVIRVALWGALTPLVALLPELVALIPLALLRSSTEARWAGLALAALAIGVIEEGTKYAFLRRFALRRGRIQRPYDGVVYGAAVAAGFAAMENLVYFSAFLVTREWAVLAVLVVVRILFPMPLHVLMGTLMGRYTGLAGGRPGAQPAWQRRRAFLEPAALHAVFDFLLFGIALAEGVGARFALSLTFLALVGCLWVLGVLAIVRTRRLPARPVHPPEYTVGPAFVGLPTNDARIAPPIPERTDPSYLASWQPP